MTVVRSKEPDRKLARKVAEDGTILRAVVGSSLHGLEKAGTDDRDEMGVCIEPPEYLIGLRDFEHFVFRSQDEGVPSGPGDLDLTVYGLRKYCRLTAKGSPTVLLLLFVEGPDLIAQTELGSELQALAPAFISRRTARSFLGYLAAQRRGLLGERSSSPRDRELSDKHGYDTKYAMHALRIAHQGLEVVTEGRMTFPVREPERSRLREVRSGEVPLKEVLRRLDEKSAALERALGASRLRAEPDRSKIDRFLVHAYRSSWA